MSELFKSCLRRRYALICAAVGLGLLLPRVALAPQGPKGPKPAARKPPAAAKPRPGPKPAKAKPGKVKHPPGKVKHPPGKVKPGPHKVKPARHKLPPKRFVRRTRYWHPRYKAAPAPTVWRNIGYPYYVGGTGYVVVTPLAEAEAVDQGERGDSESVAPRPVIVSVGSDSDADSVDTYAQIQELVELIHEWRTMNESSWLQDRLASSQSVPTDPTVASIRDANQRFDEVTRWAMAKLARGESAESELAIARRGLKKLTGLFEALPGGATG